MITHVLFDIDDTLFPSSEFAELARRNALKSMIAVGLPQTEEKLYGILMQIIQKKGSNYPHHFEDLCARLGIQRSARYVAAAVAAYHNTKAAISPYPEVPRTLLRLRERGYRLYVATNGNAIKQWDKLIRLGLALYFEEVFVSEEVGMEKSARFFQKVLASLNAAASISVMIGDREDADIRPAKKAGLKTIRLQRGKYARTQSQADAIVRDLSQLPALLKKLSP